MSLQITLSHNNTHLTQIKQLQTANLFKNLEQQEAENQGFLSAEYSIDFLETMHKSTPAVIALYNDLVVGYALVCNKEAAKAHPLLLDLVQNINAINYQGVLLNEVNYVLVGQLCIDKAFRGQGLVQKLYLHFKENYSHQYTYCLTDVATDNPRSLKAHINNGFEVVDTAKYGGTGWDIILWPWNN